VQAKHDQAAWVAGLKASASQFPLLKSVIYFNAVDPIRGSTDKSRIGALIRLFGNRQVQARRAYEALALLVPLFLRGVGFTFSCSSNSFFCALITACSAANCSGVRNCHPLSFGLLIKDLPSRCNRRIQQSIAYASSAFPSPRRVPFYALCRPM
jgi:hypothetical protein